MPKTCETPGWGRKNHYETLAILRYEQGVFMRRAAQPDHQRIRSLFLDRQESYGLTEAARLLGVSAGVLRREAEADDRDAYRSNGSWRFSWRQLVYIALRRWTLSQIHEALGADAAASLPPLLGLSTLTVQLPEFLVRAVAIAAAEDHTSISDWLHQELIDFAGTVANRMERAIPGFRRAYLFPGEERTKRRGLP